MIRQAFDRGFRVQQLAAIGFDLEFKTALRGRVKEPIVTDFFSADFPGKILSAAQIDVPPPVCQPALGGFTPATFPKDFDPRPVAMSNTLAIALVLSEP
ncbi:MAG: hypothetical protein PVG29_10005, partial [Gammaproteobacteria bacterium]